MNPPTIIKSSKKCEHCAEWTDGSKAFCKFCGEILDMQYRKEKNEWEESQMTNGPMIQFVRFKGSASNPIVFFIEKLIHGGQLILIAVITFVTFLLLLLPA